MRRASRCARCASPRCGDRDHPMNWRAGLWVAGGTVAAFLLCGLALRGLDRRGHPLASPLRGLRNLLLPLLGVVLFVRLALGSTGTTARVLETLLWIAAIHVALSFVNRGF